MIPRCFRSEEEQFGEENREYFDVFHQNYPGVAARADKVHDQALFN
jgi:hypothetical protein